MTKYKFGDVVLVVFSQTDGSKKQRPALVVLDTGDDDIVLAPVTTTERRARGITKSKIGNNQGCCLTHGLGYQKLHVWIKAIFAESLVQLV